MSSQTQRNAEVYNARTAQEELAWQKPRLSRIAAILRSLSAKTTVANLGCVSGMAMSLYKEAGAAKVEGYDLSESSLQRTREAGFEAFLWNMDGQPSPSANDVYDVVVAGEIIEHLVDTESFLNEVRRMLKSNGVLIVTTPNLASWYNRLRLLRGHPPRSYPGVSSQFRVDPLIDNNHIRVNVVSEWRGLLEHAGFSVESVEGVTHLEALQGGWRTAILRFFDRFFAKQPTLASGLIFLCRKI